LCYINTVSKLSVNKHKHIIKLKPFSC